MMSVDMTIMYLISMNLHPERIMVERLLVREDLDEKIKNFEIDEDFVTNVGELLY